MVLRKGKNVGKRKVDRNGVQIREPYGNECLGGRNGVLKIELFLQLKALSTQLVELPTQLVELISTMEDYPTQVRPGFCLKIELQRLEKIWIQRALEKAGGSQIKAAALLGVKPTTLNMKIKQYQL